MNECFQLAHWNCVEGEDDAAFNPVRFYSNTRQLFKAEHTGQLAHAYSFQ